MEEYETQRRIAEETKERIGNQIDNWKGSVFDEYYKMLEQSYVDYIDKVENIRYERAPYVERNQVLIAMKNYIREEYGEKIFKLNPDELAGVKQTQPKTYKDLYVDGDTNPFYGSQKAFSINCQTCVVAAEARIRGYEVSATGNNGRETSPNKKLSHNTTTAWIDPKTGRSPALQPFDVKNADELMEQLKGQMEKGARYTFEHTNVGSKSGHIMCLYLNEYGQPEIYDPQINIVRTQGNTSTGDGKTYYYMKHQINYKEKVYITRVDNKAFNLDVVNQVLVKKGVKKMGGAK